MPQNTIPKTQEALIQAWYKERNVFHYNQKAWIVGKIAEEFQYSHRSYSRSYYRTRVEVKRKSNVVDYIPVMMGEESIKNIIGNASGKYVSVEGIYCSHNKNGKDGKRHTDIYMVADKVEIYDKEEDVGEKININEAYIEAYICKVPIYRTTPSGRKVAEMIIAINGRRTSYIPCIAWEKEINTVQSLKIGSFVRIKARMQSRNYKKMVDNDNIEVKTTYELSIMGIDKIS